MRVLFLPQTVREARSRVNRAVSTLVAGAARAAARGRAMTRAEVFAMASWFEVTRWAGLFR